MFNDDFSDNDYLPKKKGGASFVILFLLIIFLLAGIVLGFIYVNKSEVIFQMTLNNVFDLIEKDDLFDSNNISLKGNASLEINGDEINEEISNIINDISLKLNISTDLKNNLFSASLGAIYQEGNLFDLKAYYENNSLYLNLGDLYDKNLKIESEEDLSNISIADYKIMYEEIKTALIKSLNYGYYTKSTEKLKYKNKNILVNRILLTIDENSSIEMNDSIMNYLKESDKFINVYSKVIEKDEIETFQELEKMQKEFKFDGIIEIVLYSKLLTNELMKIEYNNIDDNSNIIFNKTNDNTYEIVSNQNNVETKSNIKIDKNVIEVVSTSDEVTSNIKYDLVKKSCESTSSYKMGNTTINLNLDFIYITDSSVEKIDTENSIMIDEFGEEDNMIIQENILKNETLMKLIENIMEALMNNNENGTLL